MTIKSVKLVTVLKETQNIVFNFRNRWKKCDLGNVISLSEFLYGSEGFEHVLKERLI